MKQLILPVVLLFSVWVSVQAQDALCMPDTTLPDSVIVSPFPYVPEVREDGGITDTVCLNRDFEFTFTLQIPDTLTLLGQQAVVEYVAIATAGAVSYEPALPDFTYVCNPPNCIFPADMSGCVKIIGKTSNIADIGRHDLKIDGIIRASILGFPAQNLPVSFPNDQDPDLQGNYYLFVQDENSAYCTTSSTYAVYAPDIELTNRPNPFSEFTQIHVKSREEGRFELRVVDMLGQVVRRNPIDLRFGENIIDFDGRDLPDGLYVYTVTNGRGGVTGKMVVNHGRR